MYILHTLQIEDPLKKILKIIKQKNVHINEIKIYSKSAFQTEVEKKLFNKNFNTHDKYTRTTHKHRKFPTI